MNKDGMNIESDVVKSLVTDDSINNVGSTSSTSVFNNCLNKVKNENGIVIIIFALMFIIIAITVGIVLLRNNKTEEKKEEVTIYDKAYKTLEFKENKDLKKLKCTKKTTGDDLEIQEEETRIFYFDGNDIDTYIIHNYISLSEEYEDYFSTMYNEYKKSLTNDYKYDNVKTNLTDQERELLVTVIIDNKSTKEKKLGTPSFINYEDAKKSSIDNGYVCE